ncbi:secreted RxLR effector protein 161-like [Gossypium arboreum]|uniref:secreted RxLR effector protein 161-like n=1 Tax=Gossypium arboreum TaxID=29729 RepID=UPI0008197845|nr:secreted RxLR effector protein 161-like [Gossypium arboreum]
MESCKPTNIPIAHGEKLTRNEDVEKIDERSYKSLVRCLLYLTASRLDIMFVASLLSRFMHCCNVNHLEATKRVLRYIKGTLDHGVKFMRTEKIKLLRYSDSDWVGSSEDIKSTSNYFFTLGSSVFCWSLKKQETVSQKTAEAEYVKAATVINQAIWLRKLLNDLNLKKEEATKFKCDN